MERDSVNRWGLPAFLTITCLVPTAFGAYRLTSLILAGDWAPKFAEAEVDTLPLALHAFTAIAFLLLGALQLLPGFRGRNLTRHRRLGRIAFVMGMLGALSGIMMTLVHPGISGPLLFWARLSFGGLWAGFLLLALGAILSRDVARHRAWMLRAYAIAINAGTLPFIYFPAYLIFGEPAPLADEAIQVAGWAINLMVAEWIIRRPFARTRRPGPVSQTPA